MARVSFGAAAATALALLQVILGCTSCKSTPSAPDDGAAATSDAPSWSSGGLQLVHPPAPTTVSSVRASPPPRLPCRALATSRGVTIEDAGPLAAAAEVPDGWIDLPAGAKFSAKDPRSTRETNFEGAGRIRACVGHDEESWIAAGGFQSSPGAGERPGGEEWVFTPLGVVMYAAEDVHVVVAASGVTIDAKGPHARVWYLPDVVAATALQGIDVWSSMTSQHATLKPAAPRTGQQSDDALTKAFVDRCDAAADAAADLAAQIGAPDASLADLAGRHVKARQLARAACGVARLRLSSLAPGLAVSDQRDAWAHTVDAAETRWREVSRNR